MTRNKAYLCVCACDQYLKASSAKCTNNQENFVVSAIVSRTLRNRPRRRGKILDTIGNSISNSLREAVSTSAASALFPFFVRLSRFAAPKCISFTEPSFGISRFDLDRSRPSVCIRNASAELQSRVRSEDAFDMRTGRLRAFVIQGFFNDCEYNGK